MVTDDLRLCSPDVSAGPSPDPGPDPAPGPGPGPDPGPETAPFTAVALLPTAMGGGPAKGLAAGGIDVLPLTGETEVMETEGRSPSGGDSRYGRLLFGWLTMSLFVVERERLK